MSTILRYIVPALLILVLTKLRSFSQTNEYNTTVEHANTVNINGGNTKVIKTGFSNGASLPEILRFGSEGVSMNCSQDGEQSRTVSTMFFEVKKSAILFGVSWVGISDGSHDATIDSFSVNEITDYSFDYDMGGSCVLLWLKLADEKKEYASGGNGHVSFPISLNKTPTYKADLIKSLDKKISENKKRTVK